MIGRQRASDVCVADVKEKSAAAIARALSSSFVDTRGRGFVSSFGCRWSWLGVSATAALQPAAVTASAACLTRPHNRRIT